MEKDMITIIDNVFMPHQMELFRCRINTSIKEDNSDKAGEGFFSANEEHRNEVMCNGILKEINKYIPLEKSIGYEYWTNVNSRPQRKHQDKDEKAFLKGVDRFPMCSSVYYLTVDSLVGGELVVNDVEISAIPNRLVIFKPGLEHYVRPFAGNRVSIAVNPWETKLYK